MTRPKTSLRATLLATTFAAAALMLSGATPEPTRAQGATVPATLAGSWVREPAPDAAMETVFRAFGPTIQRLPSVLHGFARNRLRGAMEPPRSARLAVDGSHVRVRLVTDHTTTVDGNLGSRARATGVEDGTTVSTRVRGGWLEIRYFGEDSELLQLFSTEADGSRLHIDHSLTGPRIVGTVRYRIDYVPAR